MPIDYRYAEKVPGPLYTIRERDLTHIKPQILGVGEVLYCYGKKMICVRKAIWEKKSSSCFHVAPIFLNYHIYKISFQVLETSVTIFKGILMSVVFF